MRFAIAGLLLIALGIGLAEYARRNPDERVKTDDAKASDAATPDAPVPAVSIEALTAVETATFIAGPGLESFADVGAVLKKERTQSVLQLPVGVAVRELRSGPTLAAFVLERAKTPVVMTLGADGAITPWAARVEPISALSVDGERVLWVENGVVVESRGPGTEKVLFKFSKAQVTSLVAAGDGVVAALVPHDADPFSTEGNGAIVRWANGAVTVLAKQVARPRDVLVVENDAFFIGGYPSGLNRAALDGSFSARIAERADGPLAFDGTGIVYRYPETSSPQVRRVARAGGNEATLATTDTDWLAASKGRVVFSTTGIGPRVFEVSGGAAPVEAIAYSGATKGLALISARMVLLYADAEGRAVVVMK